MSRRNSRRPTGILGGPQSSWETRLPMIRKHLEHRPRVDFGPRWMCLCGQTVRVCWRRAWYCRRCGRWLHDDTVSKRATEVGDPRPAPPRPKLTYQKSGPGDYDVVDERGTSLFNVWRAPHYPSRWVVNVGNAPFPNGTRREAVRLGLQIVNRKDLIPFV